MSAQLSVGARSSTGRSASLRVAAVPAYLSLLLTQVLDRQAFARHVLVVLCIVSPETWLT